jgi:parvulin-like peptidyl-prolyl isomerase
MTTEQRLRFQQAQPPQHAVHPRWRITAAHILLDTEEFARQCIAWLEETHPDNQHACFENLAAMYSQCGTAASHGVIGQIEPGQTDRSFEQMLCSLRPGEWAREPVKTAWGWHVIARIE